jgi:hypothetical protein
VPALNRGRDGELGRGTKENALETKTRPPHPTIARYPFAGPSQNVTCLNKLIRKLVYVSASVPSSPAYSSRTRAGYSVNSDSKTKKIPSEVSLCTCFSPPPGLHQALRRNVKSPSAEADVVTLLTGDDFIKLHHLYLGNACLAGILATIISYAKYFISDAMH